ncbi:hypothetical protein [Streptomyces sp. NRRL WC-3774]|uniref:hypothetical protein n=1 Tax=Streptomyces sp. NRRL WC-3774 TaxID=1463937 RepID=UPI000AF29C70|nr:hypothetical protein [Streptomyces sp. NRRL WC-3774]
MAYHGLHRRHTQTLVRRHLRRISRRIVYHGPFCVYALGTLGAVTYTIVTMCRAVTG